MAGMLPGVESARRRRFHNSSNLITTFNGVSELSPAGTSTWRSYTSTTHHFHSHSSSSRSSSISQLQGLYDDERLSAAARQAKKRLDQRLQLPHTNRVVDRLRSVNERDQRSTSSINRPPTNIQLNLNPNLEDDDKVPKLKRSGSKRLNWLKLSWKSSEQDECAVCLEHFKPAAAASGSSGGGTIMQLPCGHKFHTNCLIPWLQGNAHCPCCRMEIPS